MNQITLEYIYKVHEEIINSTGGLHGVRDSNLLESSINNIYQTFDSVELYPTILDKAASLCYSLIQNHAFNDGNKRLGINILQVYLHLNGYKLFVTDEELIDLGLGIASSKYDKEYIKSWIIKHKI